MASLSAHDVVVTDFAFVAVFTPDVRSALASAGYPVADGDAIFAFFGARVVTTARLAIAFRQRKGITEVAGEALLAVNSTGVVDAFQTFACGAVKKRY